MKTLNALLCAAGLGLVASVGHAATLYTFELGDVAAQLHDTPCENAKVKEVLREPGDFRSAEVQWQGQGFAACWAVVGQQVVLVDETGDAGYLQQQGFRDGKNPLAVSLRGT